MSQQKLPEFIESHEQVLDTSCVDLLTILVLPFHPIPTSSINFPPLITDRTNIMNKLSVPLVQQSRLPNITYYSIHHLLRGGRGGSVSSSYRISFLLRFIEFYRFYQLLMKLCLFICRTQTNFHFVFLITVAQP